MDARKRFPSESRKVHKDGTWMSVSVGERAGRCRGVMLPFPVVSLHLAAELGEAFKKGIVNAKLTIHKT